MQVIGFGFGLVQVGIRPVRIESRHMIHNQIQETRVIPTNSILTEFRPKLEPINCLSMFIHSILIQYPMYFYVIKYRSPDANQS